MPAVDRMDDPQRRHRWVGFPLAVLRFDPPGAGPRDGSG